MLKMGTSVLKHFNKRAEDGSYAELYSGTADTRENWGYRTRRDKALNMLEEYGPGKGLLLDVGCAGGELSADFVSRGYQYVGVDASSVMIDRARSNAPGLIFQQGTADCLPLSSGSCRVVTALGLIDYLEDPDDFIGEAWRVLEPGGLLIIGVSTRFNFENWIKGILWLPRKFVASIYFALSERNPYPLRHNQQWVTPLQRQLRISGYDMLSVCYYNPKPLCFPLDRVCPGLSMRISRRMEAQAKQWPWRFTATGVLLLARKTRAE